MTPSLNFNLSNINISQIRNPDLEKKDIAINVVRLDQIHPVVSGNKLFKLQHYFSDYFDNNKPISQVITYGGAYSNHLVATAFFCKEFGIPVTGFVRGERPASLSHTLQQCIQFGMELKFIFREEYRIQCDNIEINKTDGSVLVIPEGGFGISGARGASDIYPFIPPEATHVVCALGTGTTAAGILQNLTEKQQLIVVPVLKNMQDVLNRIETLNQSKPPANLVIWDNYHFGGYAKKNKVLIAFMNAFYKKNFIPTDFVYTSKVFFALLDHIELGFFKKGAHVAVIHTGGLQGNESLGKGILNF